MRIVIIIQPIGTEGADDWCAFHLLFGNISEVNTGCIALKLDIQSKPIALHGGCQIIDILHHQIPVSLSRIV